MPIVAQDEIEPFVETVIHPDVIASDAERTLDAPFIGGARGIGAELAKGHLHTKVHVVGWDVDEPPAKGLALMDGERGRELGGEMLLVVVGQPGVAMLPALSLPDMDVGIARQPAAVAHAHVHGDVHGVPGHE